MATSEATLAPPETLEEADRLHGMLGLLEGLEAAGKGPRVLVADDEYHMRVALTELLDELGFIVAGTASNGERAARMVEAAAPDVVLMDVRMPGIDGIEATRWIREIPFGAAVVMLSGYDDPDLRRTAEEAGACAYLLKDADPNVLYDVIWRAALSDFSTPTGLDEP